MEEPAENIACGKCTAVNNVPFGLEQFKCFACGSMVSIARAQTAACAAASATAQYYTGMQKPQGSSQAVTRPPDKSSSGSGFFGKLQKTVDKTMKKVEKTFDDLTSDKPKAPTQASGVQHPQRGVPILTPEEEQLQWALNASFKTTQGQEAEERAAPTRKQTPDAPAPAKGPANAGDQLQAAAAQAAQRLQLAEDRALQLEQALAQAEARETRAENERAELRRRLEESEGLIKGLTEQLDAVNAQLTVRSDQCKVLERSLVTARQAAALAAEDADAQADAGGEEDELERQGTVAQLLARIAELEGQLMQATHFAPTPEADAPEGGARSAAGNPPGPGQAASAAEQAREPAAPASQDEPGAAPAARRPSYEEQMQWALSASMREAPPPAEEAAPAEPAAGEEPSGTEAPAPLEESAAAEPAVGDEPLGAEAPASPADAELRELPAKADAGTAVEKEAPEAPAPRGDAEPGKAPDKAGAETVAPQGDAPDAAKEGAAAEPAPTLGSGDGSEVDKQFSPPPRATSAS